MKPTRRRTESNLQPSALSVEKDQVETEAFLKSLENAVSYTHILTSLPLPKCYNLIKKTPPETVSWLQNLMSSEIGILSMNRRMSPVHREGDRTTSESVHVGPCGFHAHQIRSYFRPYQDHPCPQDSDNSITELVVRGLKRTCPEDSQFGGPHRRCRRTCPLSCGPDSQDAATLVPKDDSYEIIPPLSPNSSATSECKQNVHMTTQERNHASIMAGSRCSDRGFDAQSTTSSFSSEDPFPSDPLHGFCADEELVTLMHVADEKDPRKERSTSTGIAEPSGYVLGMELDRGQETKAGGRVSADRGNGDNLSRPSTRLSSRMNRADGEGPLEIIPDALRSSLDRAFPDAASLCMPQCRAALPELQTQADMTNICITFLLKKGRGGKFPLDILIDQRRYTLTFEGEGAEKVKNFRCAVKWCPAAISCTTGQRRPDHTCPENHSAHRI